MPAPSSLYRFAAAVRCSLAACSFVFACASDATPPKSAPSSAVFPPVILAYYEGAEHPVVGMAGSQPFIKVGDEVVRLGKDARYRVGRATSFGPDRVTLSEGRAGRAMQGPQGIDGTVVDGIDTGPTYRRYVVNARPTLSTFDCFAALVVVDRVFGKPDGTPTISIRFLDNFVLDRGKTIMLEFALPNSPHFEVLEYYPIVFAHGQAMASNQDEASSAFFRKMERERLAALVAKHVADSKGQDRNPVCLQFYPAIGSASDGGVTYPKAISALISIDERGLVDSIKVLDPVVDAVRLAVEHALFDWEFLPKLKDGKPLPAKAKVEIVFTE